MYHIDAPPKRDEHKTTMDGRSSPTRLYQQSYNPFWPFPLQHFFLEKIIIQRTPGWCTTQFLTFCALGWSISYNKTESIFHNQTKLNHLFNTVSTVATASLTRLLIDHPWNADSAFNIAAKWPFLALTSECFVSSHTFLGWEDGLGGLTRQGFTSIYTQWYSLWTKSGYTTMLKSINWYKLINKAIKFIKYPRFFYYLRLIGRIASITCTEWFVSQEIIESWNVKGRDPQA